MKGENNELKDKVERIHSDLVFFSSTHFPNHYQEKYPQLGYSDTIDSGSSSCDPRDSTETHSSYTELSESSFPQNSISPQLNVRRANSSKSSYSTNTIIPFPGLKSGRNTDIEFQSSSQDENERKIPQDENEQRIPVSEQPGRHVFKGGDFQTVMKNRRTLVDNGIMPESLKKL